MHRNDKTSHAEILAQVAERLHIMQAIESSLDRWPEVSALAWKADSSADLVAQLRAVLGVDEAQATAVADQQLRRVPREQRTHIRAQIDELLAEIAILRSTEPT